MSIDKPFHGDLEAAGKGEMLAAGSPAKGAGGYVAMERVSGSLDGRTGTFVLQHNATLQHGFYQLNVVVVPDSGTGQPTGLSGTMNISIAPDASRRQIGCNFQFNFAARGAGTPARALGQNRTGAPTISKRPFQFLLTLDL